LLSRLQQQNGQQQQQQQQQQRDLSMLFCRKILLLTGIEQQQQQQQQQEHQQHDFCVHKISTTVRAMESVARATLPKTFPPPNRRFPTTRQRKADSGKAEEIILANEEAQYLQ
jgi:hypothetical protein